MSLFIRNGIWQIDFCTASGKRIRRTTGTTCKTQALEFHDKLKHEYWRVEQMQEVPKKTWDEAAKRWLLEMQHKKDLSKDASKLKILAGFRGLYLSDIKRNFVMEVINNLPCGNSTKNRYIALVRAILRKAEREWDWLDKAPFLKQFKEPKNRIRWLTRDEAHRLIECLPNTVAEMVRFSLATGLRKSNVLFLEWSQIDLVHKIAWIHADQAKAGRPIGVALNKQAIDVLERQCKKHPQRVFTNNGVPVKVVSSTTWNRALQKAGITNFRWHDLRHTWASWLVQSGVPIRDLQEMGGWETIAMVQKYAHLAPFHLHKHAALLDAKMTHHQMLENEKIIFHKEEIEVTM